MCGISGWLLREGASVEEGVLRAMGDALAHRGPDDRGCYLDPRSGVGLAHNRLSIIDLSFSGHEPMLSEDGKTVLVYNGEIYNFVELRKELSDLGHQFVSRTDGEVLLRAYLEWGPGCVDRFYGMFAFAIWDAAAGSLFLARDPMGMKPLYYALLPQGLFFASEIKAFLALPFFKARINRHSLQQFLEFGYVFHERETSLDGVCKLPPGRFLKVDRGLRPSEVVYFKPPRHIEDAAEAPSDESVQQLSETLSEVVAQHLVADVPVGLLLSGGLDSSLIAALASRHAKVTTICMGFAESSIDEREHARAVAKHIGSEHLELLIKPRDVFEGLEDSVWCFDDLFGDWGTLTTRLLYRECRTLGIKVVLVGEGCDELFGGYSSLAQFDTMRGPLAWKMLQIYRWYSGRRYGRLLSEFSAIWRAYLQEEGGDHFYAKRKFESRNQLPNNYVMKVDKASMSVGVEARAPFLDRRVAELAYRMSKADLLSDTENKVALRKIARRDNLLPSEIASRTKFGASIAASWMDESREIRAYARDVILARDSWVDDLGLRGAMTDYFERGMTGYRFPHAIGIFSNCAWRLLLLTLWSRLYLSRA